MNEAALISLLLDHTALIDDRDDAAMDLGKFDSDIAYNALLRIASDATEPEVILWSCGGSIAQIWRRRGNFNLADLKSLTPAAQVEVGEWSSYLVD